MSTQSLNQLESKLNYWNTIKLTADYSLKNGRKFNVIDPTSQQPVFYTLNAMVQEVSTLILNTYEALIKRHSEVNLGDTLAPFGNKELLKTGKRIIKTCEQITDILKDAREDSPEYTSSKNCLFRLILAIRRFFCSLFVNRDKLFTGMETHRINLSCFFDEKKGAFDLLCKMTPHRTIDQTIILSQEASVIFTLELAIESAQTHITYERKNLALYQELLVDARQDSASEKELRGCEEDVTKAFEKLQSVQAEHREKIKALQEERDQLYRKLHLDIPDDGITALLGLNEVRS